MFFQPLSIMHADAQSIKAEESLCIAVVPDESATGA
jgi:hypothetical protein